MFGRRAGNSSFKPKPQPLPAPPITDADEGNKTESHTIDIIAKPPEIADAAPSFAPPSSNTSAQFKPPSACSFSSPSLVAPHSIAAADTLARLEEGHVPPSSSSLPSYSSVVSDLPTQVSHLSPSPIEQESLREMGKREAGEEKGEEEEASSVVPDVLPIPFRQSMSGGAGSSVGSPVNASRSTTPTQYHQHHHLHRHERHCRRSSRGDPSNRASERVSCHTNHHYHHHHHHENDENASCHGSHPPGGPVSDDGCTHACSHTGTNSVDGNNSYGNLSALGEITRHVSQSFQLTVDIVKTHLGEELVFCSICREYEGVSKTFRLSGCGHRFCRCCFASYLECKICEGQVKPTCFFSEDPRGGGREVGGRRTPVIIPPPCAKRVEEGDIKALVRAETWAKYERFKFQKKNRNGRICPWCETPVLGDPEKPEMECGKCGRGFCYFHSNAHVGRSCTEYEQRMHEEELKNQAMISSFAKPCPGCGNPVEKAGGCNQMFCVWCGEHWCWLCGKFVDKGTFPNHFQWWNVRGCPNMQMQEDVAPPSPSHIRWMKVVSFLQLVFVGPAAFVLGTVFYLLCFPCFLFKCIGQREREEEEGGEGEGEREGGRDSRDGREDGGEEGERELRQQYTGCVSFWGNTLLGLLLIPFFLTILLLCFVVTFIQVLVTSINTRFGVCCGAKGGRRGGGRGEGGEGRVAATVVAGLGSTAVAMTRSLSRGGAGERGEAGLGAGAEGGAGAAAGAGGGGGRRRVGGS
ncbi:hypothetical protein VYU27_005314 [Nannochloropsis oceanica]